MTDGAPLRRLIAAISGRPPADPDWEALIAAANRTLTIGTMAERLLGGPAESELPDDVREFLATIYARTSQRSAQMLAQLEEAVACLNAVDVEPVLAKGVAMLFTVEPGTYRGRILTDIDLFVPAASMEAATTALAEIGYRPDIADFDPDVPLVLARSRDAGAIDLHYEFKTFPHLVCDDLRRDATPVKIGDGRAWLPSPTMQMTFLVSHDQLQDRDYWRGSIDLRHLFDGELLVASPRGIDWDALARTYPGGYRASALRTHLLALSDLLDVPVPPELTWGWRPRLQHARRLVQSDHPWLMPPAAVASVLLDPPWRKPRLGGSGTGRPRPHFFTRATILFGKFTRQDDVGKI